MGIDWISPGHMPRCDGYFNPYEGCLWIRNGCWALGYIGLELKSSVNIIVLRKGPNV